MEILRVDVKIYDRFPSDIFRQRGILQISPNCVESFQKIKGLKVWEVRTISGNVFYIKEEGYRILTEP